MNHVRGVAGVGRSPGTLRGELKPVEVLRVDWQ
jgi:hypothetical protein